MGLHYKEQLQVFLCNKYAMFISNQKCIGLKRKLVWVSINGNLQRYLKMLTQE